MRRPKSLTDPLFSEWLAELHAQCFSTPRPWNAEEFATLLGQKHVFLIKTDVGFAIGRSVAGEVELLTLAVSPSARRAGNGRALMVLFEARAKEFDSTESFLEVASDNKPAIALYQSMGYRESGCRKRYYSRPDGTKLDALVLQKDL